MKPKISVIICTRDRHDTIGQAIESVAECDFPRFDIHIMDQSTTDQTKRMVEALATRLAEKCAIVYHHLDKAGLSRAYNAGMRACDGELIACTDDDVIVPKDWLARIARAFADDPDAGLLFGQVCVPESLSAEVKNGLIVPALTWEKRERLFRKDGNFKVWGMGANMAIRRTLLDRVRGFDEALGGGATLRSSQDFDFAYRTYHFGMAVLLEPDVTVDHYGTRTQEQWPATEKNYGIGDGAFYSKHIRCGDWLALRLFLGKLLRCHAKSVYLSIRRRRYVPVTDYDKYLWTGMREGRQFSIDRQFRLYQENERARMTVTDSNIVTASTRSQGNPEHGR
jgi:glycosyltransferase involved in cell wall biosynthesis